MRMQKIFPIFFIILLWLIPGNTAAYHNNGIDVPNALQPMNAKVFNDYVAAMVKCKEPEMKQALLKEKHIHDFQLRDARFDIMTGQLLIDFWILYKKTDIHGALRFEIRVSINSTSNASPNVGGYCAGLVGGLSSSKFFANIALKFAKNAINKRLVGREFWTDGQIHHQYIIFKNDNLARIINQAFIESSAGREQFKKITATIPGGRLEAGLKNIRCQLLDIDNGQAQISFDMDAAVKPDLGFVIHFNNAGSALAGFDLYIHKDDQSWWVKLNSFQLTVHALPTQVNRWLQNTINKELNNRKVFLRIEMPGINQAKSPKSCEDSSKRL